MAATQPIHKRGKFYRYAYLYFTLALIITVAGFYQSYFTKLRQTDFTHHLHGLMASTWMILLIVEPWLYIKGKIQWHRNLGKISFLIVPLIVCSAMVMTRTMIINKANYPPMEVYRLGFLDCFYMLQFVVFYVLAIIYRRQLQLHARYMAATVFLFVAPGLVRLLFVMPIVSSFTISLNTCYVLTELALIVLLIDDYRSGKIRLPYMLALILFASQHVLINYVTGWRWWVSIMDSLASLKI